MNTKIIAGCAVALAVVFGVIYLKGQTPITVNVSPEIRPIGAVTGPDVYFPMRIHDTLTTGGQILATTTTGSAVTLKETDLRDYVMIDYMSNTGASTITMPATSTMFQLLPNDGDVRTWIIHNATSTAAATLTIAKGTGMFLVGPSNADDVIDNDEYVTLTCIHGYYRSALNVDIICIIEELTDVD